MVRAFVAWIFRREIHARCPEAFAVALCKRLPAGRPIFQPAKLQAQDRALKSFHAIVVADEIVEIAAHLSVASRRAAIFGDAVIVGDERTSFARREQRQMQRARPRVQRHTMLGFAVRCEFPFECGDFIAEAEGCILANAIEGFENLFAKSGVLGLQIEIGDFHYRCQFLTLLFSWPGAQSRSESCFSYVMPKRS